MRAARSLVMAAAGAAGAAAVLAASPGTYDRLRRRLGLVEGREHFENELPDGAHDAHPSEPGGADLRLSLRARLAQDLEVEQAAAAAEPAPAAATASRPARDRAVTREQLRGARERLEAKAAAAAAALDAPGDPNVLEDDTAELPLAQDAER
jgi:hypothetical protein